jgi:hypothetical protein
MRVTCNTLDEFVENLEKEGPARIFQRVIRVSVTRRPLDEDGVKFRVNFQASAVIDLGDGEGQYLLEVGQDCGTDFEDASQETEGSERAEALKQRLKLCCREGIELRPGVVSL